MQNKFKRYKVIGRILKMLVEEVNLLLKKQEAEHARGTSKAREFNEREASGCSDLGGRERGNK